MPAFAGVGAAPGDGHGSPARSPGGGGGGGIVVSGGPRVLSWTHDREEMQHWEYWCRLSFRSTALHVRAVEQLTEARERERFRVEAARLQGPMVYCLLDAAPFQGLRAGTRTNFKGVDLPIGSIYLPQDVRQGRTHTFLACQVAVGRTTALKDGEPERYPEHFASCLVDAGPSPLASALGKASPFSIKAAEAEIRARAAAWRQVYRVKNSEQVLPLCRIEVAFEERVQDNRAIICEVCHKRAAVIYCSNDDAHFCAPCDATHHSENEFFARHQRFSLDHSPKQFGYCVHHNDQRYESVCLECKKMLCKLCLQFGPHASREHAHHRLMSTVEAFKAAMSGSTASDLQLEERRKKMLAMMQEHHWHLVEVHASFEEVQQELDRILRTLLERLTRAQARKVEFLQSVKRQVLSQMLFVQWLEGYQAHARLALPAADYVVAVRRHEHLLTAILQRPEGETGENTPYNVFVDGAVIGPVPPWIDEAFRVEDTLRVTRAAQPPPRAAVAPTVPRPALPPPDVSLHDPRASPAHPGAVRLRDPSANPGAGAVAALVPGAGRGGAVVVPAPDGDLAQAQVFGYDGGSASYMEATPRRRPGAAAVQAAAGPRAPAGGAGGLSDVVYARPKGGGTQARHAGAAGPGQLGAVATGLNAAAIAQSDFDGYVSQAFAYLEDHERRAGQRPGGAAAAAAGQRPLPGIADVAVPPRPAALQLATAVLLQLRAGGEAAGGTSRLFGCALVLLSACPSSERQLLMLNTLRVAVPIGDTAAALLKAVVEDDISRSQVPSLLAAASSSVATACQSLSQLADAVSYLSPEMPQLIHRAEHGGADLHGAVAEFIASLMQKPKPLPPALVTLCHYLYAASEVKFGVLAAQNAVVMMLTARVITPSVLKIAQREGLGTSLSDRISELSRVLQRIAHFAHHSPHDDLGTSGPPDLQQVLRNVSAMRELVSRVLSLPADTSLGLIVGAEEAEEAAAWIVEACRFWSKGLTAAGALAGTSRPAHQQAQLSSAKPLLLQLAKLGDPAAAHGAPGLPPLPPPA